MDLIDLEDDTIDAEVMDSLAVTMDNFRVSSPLPTLACSGLFHSISLAMNGFHLRRPWMNNCCFSTSQIGLYTPKRSAISVEISQVPTLPHWPIYLLWIFERWWRWTAASLYLHSYLLYFALADQRHHQCFIRHKSTVSRKVCSGSRNVCFMTAI